MAIRSKTPGGRLRSIRYRWVAGGRFLFSVALLEFWTMRSTMSIGDNEQVPDRYRPCQPRDTLLTTTQCQDVSPDRWINFSFPSKT